MDVGKNFQAAALEWFPKHGLRRIDAGTFRLRVLHTCFVMMKLSFPYDLVLITHAHADGQGYLRRFYDNTLNNLGWL